MKVTIIGTGNVGSALGGTLVRSGHDVTLTAQDPKKTQRVAEEIGARSVATAAEAVRDADVVILAVPYAAVDEVADEVAPAIDGQVVVDLSNPLTPDYSGLATAGGPSGAEHVAERFPNARVAKAFNTLFATVQAKPDALGQPVDVLYATDDDEARKTLAALIASAGFRPVDAGSLKAAGQLEALAFLNIRMQMQFGGDWKSSFVLVGAPEAATAKRAA